jgi:hypothetical protein
MKILIMQFSAPSHHFIPFSPNILLSTLLVYVTPLMSETKFHTHTEPQAKLVSYILIFMFLDSRQEDIRFWTEW